MWLKTLKEENPTVETLNLDGEVQFLYKLIDGAAQVMEYMLQASGVTKKVLERSSELLDTFEGIKKLNPLLKKFKN